MADNRSLSILGFILAGVTVTVMLLAVVTVRDHVRAERLALEGKPAITLALATIR